MTQPQEQFFAFYRTTLTATGAATRTSLEAAARLRKKQLACIEEALATHARVTTRIAEATEISDLIAASGELSGAQYQTMVSYWNGIYEAVGENQAEVARLVQSQIEQFREDLPGTLVAAPAVPAPVLAALQPLMEVASSAYALTARATAEATRLAAAQLAATAQPAKSNGKGRTA